MSTFHIVLAAVMTITILSGAAAGVLAVFDGGQRNETRKAVTEKLIHIALLGAGAIIALLGRFREL